MKKLTSIFIIALFLFTTSCDKSQTSAVLGFQIERADVNFLSKGGEGAVDLISKKALTASCKQDWCKPTVIGNRVNFTIAENSSILGRNALLIISNGEKEEVVTITQLGIISSTNFESKKFAREGGTEVFKLKTDFDLTFTFIPEGVAWLKYEHNKEKGELTITAEPMAEGTIEDRSATLLVKSEIGHEWNAKFGQMVYQDVDLDPESFVGEYTLYYIEDDKTNSIECTIKKTEIPTIFELFPQVSHLTTQPINPIPLSFSNGLLSIMGGQTLFSIPEVGTLALIAANEMGMPIFGVPYSASAKDVDGKITFTFFDSREDVQPMFTIVGLCCLLSKDGEGELVLDMMYPKLVKKAAK